MSDMPAYHVIVWSYKESGLKQLVEAERVANYVLSLGREPDVRVIEALAPDGVVIGDGPLPDDWYDHYMAWVDAQMYGSDGGERSPFIEIPDDWKPEYQSAEYMVPVAAQILTRKLDDWS